jgi:hypothetical protein
MKLSSNPSIFATQSITTPSSSVADGEQSQLKLRAESVRRARYRRKEEKRDGKRWAMTKTGGRTQGC